VSSTFPSRRRWQRFWGLLLILCDLYSVSLIGYLLLRVVFGDRLWPVALLGNFIHLMMLPGFPLLALMIWRRRWVSASLAGVVVAAFLWLFGGLFIPKAPTAHLRERDGCRPLRVMTYNTAAYTTSPEALVALIRDSGADIIALQEISDAQAVAIESNLSEVYPYQDLYGYGLGIGIGLVSRFPIVDNELFYLSISFLPYLHATLDVDGTPLTVIVAHPPRPILDRGGYHIRATDDFVSLAEMAGVDEPLLLIGDLNAADQSDGYRELINAGLRDSFREAGWGFGPTFPTPRQYRALPVPPLVRIDYILHTGDFRATRSWVGAHHGGDHLPLLADLTWCRTD
jgi:vancomycin resistance protein VanJ